MVFIVTFVIVYRQGRPLLPHIESLAVASVIHHAFMDPLPVSFVLLFVSSILAAPFRLRSHSSLGQFVFEVRSYLSSPLLDPIFDLLLTFLTLRLWPDSSRDSGHLWGAASSS